MNILPKLNKVTIGSKKLFASRVIGWGMPVALIPALRFAQDKDKKPSLRKELFVRDFSSYSVGAGIYFGTLFGSTKLFNSPMAKKMSGTKKMLATELLAAGCYCIWSGIFAPKVSKKLNKDLAHSKPTFNTVEDKPKLDTKALSKKEVNFEKRLNANKFTPYSPSVYNKFII